MNLEDYTFIYPLKNSEFENNITNAQLEEYRNANPDSDDEELRLLYHQELTRRYMNPETLNNRLMVYGKPGTGKTCQVLGVIVSNMELMSGIYTKSPWIITPASIIDSFKENLIKCVPKYAANKQTEEEELEEELEDIDQNKQKRIRKLWNNKLINRDFYIQSHDAFISEIKGMDNRALKSAASNRIIVIDEIHLLRKKREAIPDVTLENKIPLDSYELMHKFLHMGENNMILVVTGTPAVGSGKEVYDILNLLLPTDSQIDENTTINEMKKKCTGLVSFINKIYDPMREIKFIGDVHEFYADNTLLQEVLYKIKPSEYQLDSIQQIQNDEERKRGVYTEEITASICVGDIKVIVNEIYREKTSEKKLGVLKKYSGKIYTIVKFLLNPLNKKKKVFIYSNYVDNGVKLVAKILKAFGFANFTLPTQITSRNINDLLPNTREDRMIVMTGDNPNNDKLRDLYNATSNYDASLIRVVLGSPVTNAGISFFDTTVMFQLDSEWRPAYNEQAYSRIDRFNGLKNLIQKLGNPNKKIIQEIYQLVLDFPDSVDYKLHETSKTVDILDIAPKLLFLQQIAYDCIFLKPFNTWPSSYDDTLFCNYNKCNYTCDYITYNEYTNITPIKSNYRALYKNSLIKRLIPLLKQIFTKHIFLQFNELYSLINIPNLDEEILIYTLNELLNLKTIFYNKYGVKSLLVTDYNYYFLTNSLYNQNIDFAYTFYNENLITPNNTYSLEDFINTSVEYTETSKIEEMLNNINELSVLKFELFSNERDKVAEIVEYAILNKQIKWYNKIIEIFSQNIYERENNVYFHNILINKIRILKSNNLWETIIDSAPEYKQYMDIINNKIKNDIDYIYKEGFNIIGKINVLNQNEFFIIDKTFDNPEMRTNKVAKGSSNFNKERLLYILMYMIYNEKYVSNGINSINTIEFPPEFIPDKIVGITDNNIAKLIAENQNFITPLLKNLITKIKTLTPKEKLYIEYYLAWNTVIKQKLIDAISIHLNKRNIIIKV